MKRLVVFLFFYIIISMLFGCFFDNSSDEQKTSENGFDIEGFTKIETYQKLTQEDVDLLTTANLGKALEIRTFLSHPYLFQGTMKFFR